MVQPVIRLFIMSFHKRYNFDDPLKRTSCCFLQWVDWLLMKDIPKYWKLTPSSLLSANKKDDVVLTNLENPDLSQDQLRKLALKEFTKKGFLVQFIGDLSVAFTFGVLFPPLFVIVVFAMFVDMVDLELSIRQLVQFARESSFSPQIIDTDAFPFVRGTKYWVPSGLGSPWFHEIGDLSIIFKRYLSILEEELSNFFPALHRYLRWMIQISVCFWALSLYETLAAELGAVGAIWILVLPVVFPSLIHGLYPAIERNREWMFNSIGKIELISHPPAVTVNPLTHTTSAVPNTSNANPAVHPVVNDNYDQRSNKVFFGDSDGEEKIKEKNSRKIEEDFRTNSDKGKSTAHEKGEKEPRESTSGSAPMTVMNMLKKGGM
jgi:hypothetical protein